MKNETPVTVRYVVAYSIGRAIYMVAPSCMVQFSYDTPEEAQQQADGLMRDNDSARLKAIFGSDKFFVGYMTFWYPCTPTIPSTLKRYTKAA